MKMIVSFKCGPRKLQVVKAVKESLSIGLKEAKDFVDDERIVCNQEQYESLRSCLTDVGCTNIHPLLSGLFQVFLKDWTIN